MHPRDKNWGLLQHEICERFTTKFLGGSQRAKIGDFYSIKFEGDLQQNFRRSQGTKNGDLYNIKFV